MEINILNFSFNTEAIISNLDLEIHKNDKIAISGRNGVGKSALLNLIIGKYKSDIRIESPMSLPIMVRIQTLI